LTNIYYISTIPPKPDLCRF